MQSKILNSLFGNIENNSLRKNIFIIISFVGVISVILLTPLFLVIKVSLSDWLMLYSLLLASAIAFILARFFDKFYFIVFIIHLAIVLIYFYFNYGIHGSDNIYFIFLLLLVLVLLDEYKLRKKVVLIFISVTLFIACNVIEFYYPGLIRQIYDKRNEAFLDQVFNTVISMVMTSTLVLLLTNQIKKSKDKEINAKEVLKVKIEREMKKYRTFLINLSHETKTPLTLISNYLEKYASEHTQSDDLTIIKQNIDKLKTDMINFLDIEKLERNQLFYDHDQICALSVIVNEKIILFRETAARKKLRLVCKIEDNLFIKAAPAAVDRILNNLLDNAVKYTEAGGRIETRLCRNESSLILSVSDTGIGIPQEQKEFIFSPYYQLSHKKQNIQGIGMGLHIVKLILDSLQSSITVDSEPGKGSIFKITFPQYNRQIGDAIVAVNNLQKPPDTLTINPADLTLKTHDENKKTIFIAEDNVQLIAYLKNMLQDTYNIYFATNGENALKELENISVPDIIISDIMMDVLDGFKFRDKLSQIRKYQSIPFIFLTAKSSNSEKIRGLAQGAVDYIKKPFDFLELNEKIKSWLFLINLKKKGEDIEINLKHERRLESFKKEFKIHNREKEVLFYILQGLDNAKIADKMNISANTVKKHIERIRIKLELSTKRELINFLYNYIYK